VAEEGHCTSEAAAAARLAGKEIIVRILPDAKYMVPLRRAFYIFLKSSGAVHIRNCAFCELMAENFE
jgi:hypothetical protein